MKRDNHTFLTTAPIPRVILTMSVPTVISMLVTSFYNLVDTYYVGLLNTQATAAVGIVFPIMSIIQAVGFFFGQGSGTYISRALGAKKREEAEIMSSTAFYSAFFGGVLIAVFGLIFIRPLSIALGSTQSILPYTIEYLGVILLGAPFWTSTMVLNNQMRFQGNANLSMVGMLTGAILNVALVPLFTFTFNLGILGTAIGTVVSQFIGFIVMLAMTRRGDNIRLNPLLLRKTNKAYFWEIVKGGTPSLTRQGLASISTVMLNVASGAYGDAAIAGMSIVTRITFLVFATILGIGQGFQPFCGFNYGARLFDRLKKGYIFTNAVSIAFLLVVSIPLFIFAEEVVYLMREDPEVVLVGAAAFRWQIITFPLASFVMISNMTLQTSGASIPANILASSRNGIFFIPLIIILPKLFGLTGVEMCQAVADVFSFLLAAFLMVKYFKKLNINKSNG